MTYQSIIHISNEIRFVLNTSRQVNLAAQNASLAARRAGNAWGFQVVSVELKTFSQQLGGAMGKMAEDIYAVAESVSANYRHFRIHCYQQTTLNNAQENSTASVALTRVLTRSDDYMKDIGNVLAVRIQSLDTRVAQSLRLCNYGRALARSAMIEATSCGLSLALLRNVAHDIERTIEDIQQCLKKVKSYLMNDLVVA